MVNDKKILIELMEMLEEVLNARLEFDHLAKKGSLGVLTGDIYEQKLRRNEKKALQIAHDTLSVLADVDED